MNSISILGIYAADLVFFGDKIPKIGETVLGKEHIVGPGGKGSNQAVGSAKAGGKVNFISKVGNDQYGQVAIKMYKELNIDFSKQSYISLALIIQQFTPPILPSINLPICLK